MTDEQRDVWRWLEAEEAGGDWDAADASFAAVAAQTLSMLDSPQELTERIMAAVPRTAETPWARAVVGLIGSWWVRGAVGAAMLVLGIAASVLTLGQFITMGSVLSALTAGGGAVLETISTAWNASVAAWPVAVSLSHTAAMVTVTRTAVFVVLINLVLATGAFVGLTRLLPAGEEES